MVNNFLRKVEQEMPMIENVVTVGNKVEMKSVEQVILPDGTEGRKLYKTQIYDIDETGIIKIMMPMEKTKFVLLPVDGEYEVCFFTDSGMYKGNVRIIDREKVDNNYVLITELITTLSKFQRREFYRFNCVLEMSVKNISESEASTIGKKLEQLVSDEDMVRGVIVDISGGGLRFVSRELYTEGSMVYIKFRLPLEADEKEYSIAGRIVSSNEIENRKKEYENRVKFVYLDNISREEIIKYIFKEERKNRKNMKGC